MKFYKTSGQGQAEFTQGVMQKLVMIALAVVVPVCSIFGAVNILFRIPDFYRYEFDRAEVTNSLDLGIDSTVLGSFFSKFMLHSESSFSLIAEFEGTKRELFNQAEAALVGNFRVLLDVLLIFAIAALLITIFLIAIMQFNKMAKALRRALNIGLVIYVAAIAALAVYFNVYSGDVALKNSLLDGSFKGDDLLQQMFDERFTLDATVVIVVISFIIMMIVRYIVWRMTAQKGVFSEGLRGIAE